MTFDEYYVAFMVTSIAESRSHYVNSFKVIQRDSRSKDSVLEFEVPGNEVFFVHMD